MVEEAQTQVIMAKGALSVVNCKEYV